LTPGGIYSGLHAQAYSFDDGASWQTANSKVFTSSQQVKIKVKDIVENTSESTGYDITITTPIDDLTGTISFTSEAATNGDVVATLTTNKPLKATPADWQQESATTYTRSFSVNGAISVTFTDTDDQIATATAEINWIDNILPVIDSITETTGTNSVTLTVNAYDPATPNGIYSGLHTQAYSFDNGANWQTGNSKVFTGTPTVAIQVRDHVGNRTGITHTITKESPRGEITFTETGATK
jgi:hypothetical protein